jgi:hypothetical protein
LKDWWIEGLKDQAARAQSFNRQFFLVSLGSNEMNRLFW